MGFLDSLFGKPKEYNKGADKPSAPEQKIDTSNQSEFGLNTGKDILTSKELVDKFQYASSLLQSRNHSKIYVSNSVMKQEVKEYHLVMDNMFCKIKSIPNIHKNDGQDPTSTEEFHHKWEVSLPPFDIDGDGDIDNEDRQQFSDTDRDGDIDADDRQQLVISDHGNSLRFIQYFIKEDGTGHFKEISTEKGMIVLNHIQQFIQHGVASKEDLGTKSRIMAEK